MEYFWTHKDNMPEGHGYGQFSFSHFMWIAACALFTAFVTFIYRRALPGQRITILRTLSFTLIASEIIKMIVLARSDIRFSDYLPLELCSFAGYSIFLDSLFPGNAFFPQMLLTLFMPAALMAILFPTTSTLPSFNFFTIHQFLYHALIVAYVIARFACGEILITYPEVWGSILKVLVLVAFIYVVDRAFKKNFMFLVDPYGNPLLDTIWKITGGGFGYTMGFACFSIVMIHVFYLIFKILAIIFIR